MRHPSSHCFVRAWGNDTSKIINTYIESKLTATSKIVCEVGECAPEFSYFSDLDKCVSVTKGKINKVTYT